jgi:hypothetical protein
MSYTVKERQQIARQIRAFAQAGKVETWRDYGTIGQEVGITPRLETRAMTATEAMWLDVVALDVMGKIAHEG